MASDRNSTVKGIPLIACCSNIVQAAIAYAAAFSKPDQQAEQEQNQPIPYQLTLAIQG